MNTEHYEQEIDLKELIFYLLYRWRLLLAAALVGMAALGGFQFLKWKAQPAGEPIVFEQRTLSEIEELEKLALEQSMEALRNNLEAQNRYMTEAPYMQINPYEVYYASADFLIEAQGAKAEADLRNLIEEYKYDLTRGSYLNELAEQMQTETGYIKELISVWGDYGLLESPYLLTEVPAGNVHQGKLYVQVSGPSAEWSKRLLDGVKKELAIRQEALQEEMAAHTIRPLCEDAVTGVDTAYLDRQLKIRSYGTNIHKSLEELQKNLDTLEQSKAEDFVSLNETGDLEWNQKEFIKYLFLGFLAGGFLISCAVGACYIFNDRVLSEKEIHSRFAVKGLGEFKKQPKKRAFDFIDSFLRRLAGDDTVTEEAAVYEMIQANIQIYAGERRHLLLTGLASEAWLKQVREQLSSALPEYHFEIGRDLVSNAGVRKQLAACEGVVLVEETGVSRYSLIGQELKLAGELGVEVVGVIVG